MLEYYLLCLIELSGLIFFLQFFPAEKIGPRFSTQKLEEKNNVSIMHDSVICWTILYEELFYRPNEITDEEYIEFYKSLTKDHNKPLTKVHFVAEGEVTFKSVLFVPPNQPGESFNKYGSKTDNIKVMTDFCYMLHWNVI